MAPELSLQHNGYSKEAKYKIICDECNKSQKSMSSLTSSNTMNMNNNNSNLSMTSSNSGHSTMNTFNSNPFSLSNKNVNDGGMNLVHANMGSGIDISQQSIPSYHPQQKKSFSLLSYFYLHHETHSISHLFLFCVINPNSN